MNYGLGTMEIGAMIIWLLFWILLIIGLVLLIKYLWGGQESALEVLKKRYARGEISKEEFEEKKKGII
ncbi:Uncharacterised protein [uncultured archaeon]|nr:Uncharacterised protein [uncultured archaeon]